MTPGQIALTARTARLASALATQFEDLTIDQAAYAAAELIAKGEVSLVQVERLHNAKPVTRARITTAIHLARKVVGA